MRTGFPNIFFFQMLPATQHKSPTGCRVLWLQESVLCASQKHSIYKGYTLPITNKFPNRSEKSTSFRKDEKKNNDITLEKKKTKLQELSHDLLPHRRYFTLRGTDLYACSFLTVILFQISKQIQLKPLQLCPIVKWG